MKKKSFVISMLLMLSMIFTACTNVNDTASNQGTNESKGTTTEAPKSNDPPAQKSDEPITLGMVAPFSGAYAVLGNANLSGIQLAIDEANAGGGVLGRTVEIKTDDSKADPNELLTKAERFALSDKINLFIGTVASGESVALASKMQEWNSLYVSTSAKTVKLTNPVNPNVFRADYSDAMEIIIHKHWLLTTDEGKKAQTFYAVGADYAWGHDQIANFKNILEQDKPGSKLLGEAYYPIGTTDFSAHLNQIASMKPDVAFLVLSGGDLINFLNQAHDFGIKDTKFLTFLVKPVIAESPNAIGVAGSVMYHHSIDNPLNKEFVENFKKKFGTEPDDFAGYAYIGAKMLFNAIEAAGTTETQKVIEALEKVEFDTIVGSVKMNPETHELVIPGYMGETVAGSDGKAEIRVVKELSSDIIQPAK